MAKARIAVAALTLSAAGLAAWIGSEGFTPTPVIPTKGDVPTIGHGSTRYEDGTPVRMTDPAITPERAVQLARNLHSQEEARFRASLPNVKLTQGEYDVYLDFTGNFGIGNWRSSSMRRNLLATTGYDETPEGVTFHYRAACAALLNWKRAGGYDCSTPGNHRCPGVWTRQLERHAKCMAE